MTPTDHTYQTVNNNDDCAICDAVMLSTDQLGTVFVRGERLLAHWDCRRRFLTSRQLGKAAQVGAHGADLGQRGGTPRR